MNDMPRGPKDGDEVREMIATETVLSMIPISRTTLFRLERDGKFPKGRLITPHRKLFFKDEVVAWQKGLWTPPPPGGVTGESQ